MKQDIKELSIRLAVIDEIENECAHSDHTLEYLRERREEAKKELAKLTDVLCNQCGHPCNILGEAYGLRHAKVSGGYYSTPGPGAEGGALDDGNTYTFSLCEFCLDHLFSQFRIPVDISSYMFVGEKKQEFIPAAIRVKTEEYRKDGAEAFFKEAARREASRKK